MRGEAAAIDHDRTAPSVCVTGRGWRVSGSYSGDNGRCSGRTCP